MRPVLRRTLITLLALLALAPGVPLAAANREHQQLMADIRMLQEQNQQLQLLLGQLQEALKAVTLKIDDQTGINRKTAADQKLLIDNMSGDVRVVREKLDDTNVRLSSLSQELEALRDAIPKATTPPSYGTEPSAAAPGMPAPEQPAVPGAPPLPPPAAPPSTAGLSPQRMYDEARSDYSVGNFALALVGFETLIKTFPRSDLAASAQYYIGESHLLENKLDLALAGYNAVIVNYPNSPEVAGAYYKRGLMYYRLNQPDKAIESWEYVIKNYPDSNAAGLAKQSLDGARRARPQ